ncbi:cupin domain-containing protein [Haloarcula nitratireducens]|uniref:Cupin domain-containing protein n=1 Tax=Haloarcula nitratireducens TaxID=2487749 RepID=A0AAW4PF32_9EURY|nr:cupin domain-containing protein [Halomicroarcula nitratireducens]MBX0296347.1 cupin domain-containing protein [Halomicroarcula nitratireducens]
MAYHHLDPDDLPETEDYPCDRRGISDAAELHALHAATYEMAPGEQLPRSYHYHERREELFYVRSGRLHVETPEGEFVVPEDEVFVAEPESPHRAFNPDDAEESVKVLGVGAPKTDIALPYDPGE